MVETSTLWHATFRKEAMDLLEKLWMSLDEAGRTRLADALIAGPPPALLANIEEGDRDRSRDRRIFDRIVVIERLGDPPLTPALQDVMATLRERYPEWHSVPGERAHFGSWMEMRWGPATRFSVDDLASMSEEDLATQLTTDFDRREGLLDAWRQLVSARPRLGLNILMTLGHAPDPGPVDLWEYALMGLRDADNAGLITDHMLVLLGEVPEALFQKRDMIRAAADLLEAKSRDFFDQHEPPGFWPLFDRALEAASAEAPDEVGNEMAARDWVTAAVNHSLGKIATAFINALFAGRPRVGEGLPDAFAPRADLLASPKHANHRVARVIFASRISYLYAVDPEWTARALIPSFGWSDEEESIAMWQAYAWQARIDPQLWAELKPVFLPLFTPERLARMGNWAPNVAQSLMLVGVAFDAEELKRDATRDAIRAMPDEMRQQAAAWIVSYMEAGEEDNSDEDEEPIEGSPDARWTQRVWPWLKRVWPTESGVRSPAVAEQFAMAAIATDDLFPEAVKAIGGFAAPTPGYRVVRKLVESKHPDTHPRSALDLLDAFVDPGQPWLDVDDLNHVLERIGAADHGLNDDNRLGRWRRLVVQRTG